KNVIAEYGVEPDQIKQAAISEYAHSRGLLSELNDMKTEIEDLQVKLKVLRKYRKLKVYGEELKALSGSAAKKYRKEYSAELTLSKTEAKTGETAEITVSLASNPGLCALGFAIEYDNKALSVISAEFTDLLADAAKRINTQDGKIIFNATSADNISGDGKAAKITFKVISADFKGTDVSIKVLGEKGFVLHAEADHSIIDVQLKLTNGAVLPYGSLVTDAPVTDPITTDAPTTDTPATDAPATACVHSSVESETVKQSTCSTKGLALTRCADCGISLGEVELPLTEHKAGEWETVTKPTDEKEGEAVRRCTECGQQLETKVLEKLVPSDGTSDPAVTTANVPADTDENGGSTVILIVLGAVILAGGLIAFALFRARADRKRSEADFY
ncbi:MAG: hypothetical protein IJF74_00750, partial [Clostridia bacterium]|nr:hypothetical protein [Clostridia bacterium]